MRDSNSPSAPSTTLSRRQAVVGAGAAGALATAVVAVPLAGRRAVGEVAAVASAEGAGGYRVTPHVLRYYDTARV